MDIRIKQTRPRFYESRVFPWISCRVPETLTLFDGQEVPHPARSAAVFLVHGIGDQHRAQTAATLRNGFERALEEIQEYQRRKGKELNPLSLQSHQLIPSPFVQEGYWANYATVEEFFPEDWARFNEWERSYFQYLFSKRIVTAVRTYRWFLKQQIRLLGPSVLREVGLGPWLLYWPFQIVSLFTLTLALLRYPRIVNRFLADVRLYMEPQGMIENAIVQRIDERVAESFLQTIGLDRDFRPLPTTEWIEASGERLKFDRVVWVAHSLGTVISYNVLSDLFHRALYLGDKGDALQKEGVCRLRGSLRRFITLGSPLDKVAFLFAKKQRDGKDDTRRAAIRPWPKGDRRAWLEGGEIFQPGQPEEEQEWWVNFYHVGDPVSGPLNNPIICGTNPPANYHIGPWHIPGYAHVAYWGDTKTMRFVLGRTYGYQYMPDEKYVPMSPAALTLLAALFYFVWAFLLSGLTLVILWWALSFFIDLPAAIGRVMQILLPG